jgi:single-stranded DNA-binding protein
MASNGHWLTAIGVVASEPEQRFIPEKNGTSVPVTIFKMAVNEKRMVFGSKSEKKEEFVTWYRVTVVGSQSPGCYEHLHKGDTIHVLGRPGISVWKQDETGKAFGYITIQTYDVRFIELKREPPAQEYAPPNQDTGDPEAEF